MSKRRVLILAYLFPPLGGIGVQRPLKFTRYLRDYGWEPTVLTTDQAYSAFYDNSLLAEIPSDVQVVRVADPLSGAARRMISTTSGATSPAATGEGVRTTATVPATASPARWRRFLKRGLSGVKNALLIPDESLFWALRAAWRGRQLIAKQRAAGHPIDAIYTTSGPHSTHFGGWLLKRWTGVKWVADFRDPWTQNMHFTHSGLRRVIEEAMESRVFAHADAVITVTDGFADLFRTRYPKHADKVQVIRNGVDPIDFPHVMQRKPTERFTLFYGGILYPKRTPAALFQALNTALRYGKLRPEQIRVQFAGVFDYPGHTENQDLVRELGLESVVEVVGYLPHEQVLRRIQEVDALLLIGERTGGSNPYVPGKLYEYLYVKKPILALLEEGEAARLIAAEQAGVVFDFADVAGITQTLVELVEEHQRRIKTPGHSHLAQADALAQQHVQASPYTRQGQTAELARLMNGLMSSPTRANLRLNEKTTLS